MRKLNVLLVNSSHLFLQSATRLLSMHERVQIVGFALSGGEALAKSAQLGPDLVLLDLATLDVEGFATAQNIKSQPASPCVVIMSLFDLSGYHEAAQTAKVDALVSTNDLAEELRPLIDSLLVSRCQ